MKTQNFKVKFGSYTDRSGRTFITGQVFASDEDMLEKRFSGAFELTDDPETPETPEEAPEDAVKGSLEGATDDEKTEKNVMARPSMTKVATVVGKRDLFITKKGEHKYNVVDRATGKRINDKFLTKSQAKALMAVEG